MTAKIVYFLAQTTLNLKEDLTYKQALEALKLNIEDIIEFELATKKTLYYNYNKLIIFVF